MSQEQETAMYDQPDDDLAEERPVSRKHKRKVKALKRMDYSVTPAQAIMRSEMARGVHQPERLDSVLADLGIPDAGDEVKALALSIIENTPNQLSLGFCDWADVQKLVETAILAGYSRAQEDGAADLG
jgi:hypothetical protein